MVTNQLSSNQYELRNVLGALCVTRRFQVNRWLTLWNMRKWILWNFRTLNPNSDKILQWRGFLMPSNSRQALFEWNEGWELELCPNFSIRIASNALSIIWTAASEGNAFSSERAWQHLLVSVGRIRWKWEGTNMNVRKNTSNSSKRKEILKTEGEHRQQKKGNLESGEYRHDGQEWDVAVGSTWFEPPLEHFISKLGSEESAGSAETSVLLVIAQMILKQLDIFDRTATFESAKLC